MRPSFVRKSKSTGSPGWSDTPIGDSFCSGTMILSNGMYSPNGTRCCLWYTWTGPAPPSPSATQSAAALQVRPATVSSPPAINARAPERARNSRAASCARNERTSPNSAIADSASTTISGLTAATASSSRPKASSGSSRAPALKQQGALRCTSATRTVQPAVALSAATMRLPTARHARIAPNGSAVSSMRAKRPLASGAAGPITGAATRSRSVANTPFRSTTSAETRYTPPKRAGVAKAGISENAVPRKFHGKPVNSVPRSHSTSAHSPASPNMHNGYSPGRGRAKRHILAARNPKSAKQPAHAAESANQPKPTSGHGPLFFTTAGIHDSDSTQYTTPNRKKSTDERFGEHTRAIASIGTSATIALNVSRCGTYAAHKSTAAAIAATKPAALRLNAAAMVTKPSAGSSSSCRCEAPRAVRR